MKAVFIVVTCFVAVVPYLVPTADASAGMLGLERSSTRSDAFIGGSALLVWAMLGLSLLKGARN